MILFINSMIGEYIMKKEVTGHDAIFENYGVKPVGYVYENLDGYLVLQVKIPYLGTVKTYVSFADRFDSGTLRKGSIKTKWSNFVDRMNFPNSENIVRYLHIIFNCIADDLQEVEEEEAARWAELEKKVN